VREANSHPATALPQAEPLWFTEALKLLQEVNGRLLDLLALASQLPIEVHLPLAVDLSDVLEKMDSAARARAAACPFLLIDGGFQDLERWSRVRWGAEPVEARAECFPRPQALELAHMTFMLAWSLVRSNRNAACTMLGLSAGCTQVIGDLRLQDLQRIAVTHSAWIRPRWENRPDIWRRLLRTGDEPGLRPVATRSIRELYLFFGHVLKGGSPRMPERL
jgi:hypothetical protein